MEEIAFAGAGFASAVLARELAESGKYTVTIFEERAHTAGNCYTERDPLTGVMVHQYGPHIFHTDREQVWNYVRRFGEFMPFTNRVKAVTRSGVYSLPINLLTINQFFGQKFTPREAESFIRSLGDKTIDEPQSFEEQALKMMGRELYEEFFFGYTCKQWGVHPKELPASILKRLPMRFSYDDNYYVSRFQGIPRNGYTEIVDRILKHPRIQVRLGTRFRRSDKAAFSHVFFSGPMDAYFDYCLGRLRYRSLVFDRFDAEGDYQGNPVLNYCTDDIPFTRITEHKHFAPWEKHDRTVCFREFSKATEDQDTPYYPLRLNHDKQLLARYLDLVEDESGVTFIGRLGTYRYLDMHMVIGESLELAKLCLTMERQRWPRFSVHPLPEVAQAKSAA